MIKVSIENKYTSDLEGPRTVLFTDDLFVLIYSFNTFSYCNSYSFYT